MSTLAMAAATAVQQRIRLRTASSAASAACRHGSDGGVAITGESERVPLERT